MACYSVRTIKPFMCQENLKSIYYSCFHSVMTYGIIFWGNSTHSIHVFWLRKRVIRIITNSKPRDSSRQLSKKLGSLPLMSQHIFPLLWFIVNNKALFQMNSEIYSINTLKAKLTPRLLMSYIYIYMERIFLMFLDHTQRRTTVGRTPLDEW